MTKKIYDVGSLPANYRPKPPPPAPDRNRARSSPGGMPGGLPASPVVLLLAYVTGPLAPLVTANGWSRRAWRSLALIGGLGWVASALLWAFAPQVLSWGAAMCVAWPVTVLALMSLGSVSWARGVRWAQREVHVGSLPAGIRHPLTGGVMGFLLPGLAHTLTLRSKRAVTIVALSGPLVAALLITLRTREIWRANADAALPLLADPQLEHVLIGCAIGAAAAVVGWLAQGLDGMRVASMSRGIDGSWVSGLALILLVGAGLVVAVEHEPVAEQMDRAATRFDAAGFAQVPLWLWDSAAFLDASEPVYALRAARLHERAGDTATADAMRRDLNRRWDAYRQEAALEGDTESDEPIRTAERNEPRGSVGHAPGPIVF